MRFESFRECFRSFETYWDHIPIQNMKFLRFFVKTSHFTSFNQSGRLYWGLWGMILRWKTLLVQSGGAVKKLKHLLDSKNFLKGLWCMPNNILEPLSDCACRCWRTAPESLILPPFSSKKVRKINGFHPILKLQKVKNMDFGEKDA